MRKLSERMVVAGLAVSLGVGALASTGWALTPQSRPYYLEAQAAERHGHLEAAEAALRKAVALDPDDYLNPLKLAAVLNQQGKPREALSYYQKALALNPQDAMILYSMGGVYEQLGDYAKARECYALTLQNSPQYQFALQNLARVEIQQRDYESAVKHYQAFLTRYPDHFQARRHLAKLYLVTGQPQLAAKEYEFLKAQFPDRFGDHLDLAKSLNGSQDPQRALEELRAAYAREGDKSDIAEEMGRSLMALKQVDQAIIQYQRAYELNPEKDDLLLLIGDLHKDNQAPDKAVASYRAYLAQHPEAVSVRRILANVHLDQKQYDEALAELQAMLPAMTDAEGRYTVQKDMAYARQMKGELSEAIAAYEALMNEPQATNDLQLQLNLALAYHKTQDYAKAVATYKRIYYAGPERQAEYKLDRDRLGYDMAAAMIALGDAAYKAQDYQAALAHYGEASLFAAQDNVWPYLGLGNTYYAMNLPDKAYDAYGMVLQRDPNQVTARLYRAKLALSKPQPEQPETHVATLETLSREHPQNMDVLLALANAYETRQNVTGALSVYEKALALQPENPELLLAVGTQWQKLGNLEQARKAYERGAALAPDRPVFHYNLGIVYNELGLLDQSVAAYRQAIRLDPAFSDSRYGLAVTYEKQQKFQEALESYEAYIQQPGARYQKEAAERIDLLRQSLNLPKAPAQTPLQPPATEPPADNNAAAVPADPLRP